MTPTKATKSCLKKYATFAGRAQRGEYWWFLLVAITTSLVVSGFARLVIDAPLVQARVDSAFAVLIFLPLVAAGYRRLHDTGRSGWLMLLAIASSAAAKLLTVGGILNVSLISPLATGRTMATAVIGVATANILWTLAVLAQPSQPGPNRYGPNPNEVLS
jgi:uncharacterized membrane protein YhaH (DUF805 family)